MEWSDDYTIGVEQIDEQHQRFFDFVNDLAEAGPSDSAAIDEKMEFLKNYALEHFDAEEAFMEAHGYPQLNKHAQLHVDFIRQYSDLVRAFRESADQGQALAKIRELAETWLVSHITKTDADYARYVREKSGGDS